VQVLKLGTAKVNITPKQPIPLGGLQARVSAGKGYFEGISHPLYARILFFRHIDQDGSETPALLVSAELLCWGEERVPQLKRKIRDKWGIDESRILFHATHIHSGPQTSSLYSKYLGKFEPAYVEQMENWVLQGVDEAAENMEDVSVERGIGHCRIGLYRRQIQDEFGNLLPRDTAAPQDHEMQVISYQTLSGKRKAILVHYACHPVTTTDNFISSEFAGVGMNLIEREVGEGVISAYLQGFCGDINPCNRGSDPEVLKLGRRLADDALGILKRSMQTLDVSPLTVRTKIVLLPLQKIPTKAELSAVTKESRKWDELWPNARFFSESSEGWAHVVGEWSRCMLESYDQLPMEIPLEMTYVSIADGLSLLAMNAEFVVEYGLFLKEKSHGRVLPLGYSNGMFGYVSTARQIGEGGYEPVGSVP
jgi:hypothetical protein